MVPPAVPPPTPAAPEGARHAALGWSALSLLLVVEALLFRAYVLREVAWAYPAMWDQVTILFHAYEAYDRMRHEGLLAGLFAALARPATSGALAPAGCALLMRALGPTRLAALSLNFAWFALAQVALVAALRRLSRDWTVPALGLGLWLSARTAFGWGGLFDMRLDFGAACLYAVFVSLAAASEELRSPRRVLLAGGAAAVLVLYRHLTLAYVLAIAAGLALAALPGARRGDPQARQRLHGVGLLCALTLVPLLPLAPRLLGRTLRYYAGATVDLQAYARLSGVGAGAAPLDVLSFYPRSLWSDHAGVPFLALSALVCGTALVALTRALASEPAQARGTRRRAGFLVLALLAPLALLSVYPSKSRVVGGVLVAPLVWLAALPALALARRGAGGRLRAGLAALVLPAGALAFAARCLGPGPLSADRASAEAVVQLHRTIAQLSFARGWPAPRIGWDAATDFQLGTLLVPIAYESYGRLLAPQATLGLPPMAPASPEAIERAVAGSDFLIVTREGAPQAETGFGLDASMHVLRPRLLALCRQQLVLAASFRAYGRELDLFTRAEGPVPASREKETR